GAAVLGVHRDQPTAVVPDIDGVTVGGEGGAGGAAAGEHLRVPVLGHLAVGIAQGAQRRGGLAGLPHGDVEAAGGRVDGGGVGDRAARAAGLAVVETVAGGGPGQAGE